MSKSTLAIRNCHGLDELSACVSLHQEVWNFTDAELVPLRMFVVAQKIGGQTIGAFDDGKLVAFALSLPGSRSGRCYLHSQMLAVRSAYRNAGLGRQIKLFQRADALSRGFELMEWTFDPLEIKNAYLNIERLGAIARRYHVNQYGLTSSPLQGGLPSDRLVAEWWLKSRRVENLLGEATRPEVESKFETEFETKLEREFETLKTIPVPAEIYEWKSSPATRIVPAKSRIEIETISCRRFLMVWQSWAMNAIRGAVVNSCWGVGTKTGFIPLELQMKIEAITLREIQMPLVHFFETSFGRLHSRRILLLTASCDGVDGWSECVAGEDPFYSSEWIETAWTTIKHYLAPAVLGRPLTAAHEVAGLMAKVRGHRMAKAAIENAAWDAEARQKQQPLWKLLGGATREIQCGVSIGIQDSVEQLLQKIETELAAGYRRIKVKVKPGWDVNVLERIRTRWPDILLSCDANSAYTLDEVEHLRKFDRFNLLMIEQPLWNDDIYYHARLQRELSTAICLDESIRHARDAAAAVETGACRIVNVKVGRIGGFSEARKVHDVCQNNSVPVWCGGMLESGVGRAHNIALSTLPNFRLPGDVSASKRYWKKDIVEPEVEVSAQGTIVVSDEPGTGYRIREDLIEKLAVNKETFGV